MSLLTQFYPGPGGGGGGGAAGAGGGGVPSMIAYGSDNAVAQLTPTPNGFASNINSLFNTPTVFSSVMGCSWTAVPTSTIPKLTFNNVLAFYTPNVAVPVKEIELNGSFLRWQAVGNQPALTKFTGTGTLGFGGSQILNLTSIATTLNIDCTSTVGLDAKLDADSLNHILINMVDQGAASFNLARTCDLSGTAGGAGTSALTPAGLAARNALVAAGWTVTLNS